MFVNRDPEQSIPILPDDDIEFLPTLTRAALRATGMYDLRQRIKKLNPKMDRRTVRDLARLLHKQQWDARDQEMIRQSKARLPYIRKKGSNTLAEECGIFGIERPKSDSNGIERKTDHERLTSQSGGGISNDSAGGIRDSGVPRTDGPTGGA